MNATAKITRLTALVVMLAAPLHAFAQPHVGVWTSIDPHDGSRAYIGVNAALQIVFFDSDATFGCREGGGGPFLGIDENNGNSVRIEGHVLIGYLDGTCQNGGKNHNTSFDFGMGHFPEFDTIRSRGTDWDRTYIDPETFVASAFELEKLSPGAWEFFSGYSGGDPQIIPGAHCDWVEDYVAYRELRIFPGLTFDLRACDLATVLITGSGINSIVREAYLAHANIFEASFYDADFSGADLHGANISLGGISNSNFRYANLSSITFDGTILEDLDLTGADLRNANFGDNASSATSLILRKANLTDADFRNLVINSGTIDLRRANLTRARFPFTGPQVLFIFHDTICPDGSNSNDNGGICHL